MALAFAYTVYRAWTLSIDYCDSFMYRQSAMRLWGYELEYFDLRPPLLAMVLAPVIELARSAGAESAWLLRATALEAAFFSALSVIAIVWAMKRPIGLTAALFGAALFVANRFFIRYGAHVMTDIVTAGTISAAIAAYLAGRERRHLGWFLLSGLFLGMTALLRYNVMTVFPGLFVGELFVTIRRWRVNDRGYVGLMLACVVSLVLFVVVHRWVFELVYGDPSLDRFVRIYEQLSTGSAANRGGEEPWDYVSMSLTALGPVPLGLAAAGLLIAVVWFKDADGIFLGVLLALGGAVYLAPHTEARYAIPLLPCIVYFAARSAEHVATHIGTRLREWHWAGRALAAAVVIATCAGAAHPGIAQAGLDHDPIFRTPAFFRVADAVRRSRSGRAWWNGMTTTLCPANQELFPEDDFFNVFHSCVEGIAFYTGKAPLVAREQGTALESVFAQRGRDGDLVIELADLRWPDTRELRRYRPPMRFTTYELSRFVFRRSESGYEHADETRGWSVTTGAPGAPWTFTSNRARGRFAVFARHTDASIPLRLGELHIEPNRPTIFEGTAGTSPAQLILVGAGARTVIQAP